MTRRIGVVAAIGLSLGSQFQGRAESADDAALADKVRAHVSFLGDDLLEGRGTGQRGHQIAALYVAAQYLRLGLKPAGDSGAFLQRASFLESTNSLDQGKFEYRADNAPPLSLALPNDALVVAAPGETEVSVSAPVVFIGYGVRAPEFGHDDLRGVDLKGKIAVVLSGAPPWLPSEPRAHFTSSKLEVLAGTGAVGVVTLRTPREERRQPWSFAVNGSRFPSMRLLNAKGAIVQGFPELKARATLNQAASIRWFKAAGQDFEEVVANYEAKQRPSVSLGGTLTLEGHAKARPAQSMNVLGLLPGTDPELANEPLVITAHVDHIGIGPALNGDSIYNGTLDNAMGSSVALVIAERLASGPRPRRPVLFAAVTGEEKGLLGANHLSLHPPAGVKRFAGNINIDMPLFIRETRDIVGWGSEHTTLGAVFSTVAQRQGFQVRPDPIPDETIFVRSDQYPFIQQGVPALYVGTFFGDAENAFLKERYHKPNDDLGQPLDWNSAGAFARMMTDLIQTLAADPVAPSWIPGDFFGKTFATPR